MLEMSAERKRLIQEENLKNRDRIRLLEKIRI